VSEPMTDDRLAPEVADLLRDAARARTEGSSPLPRMHRAIRRDRNRRAVGGTMLAAAAVVAATVATGVVGADRAAPPPGPAGTPSPTPTAPRTPEPGPASDPLNLAGPAAGSLAGDTAWLQGMKQRLVEMGKASDPAHARVLWAADSHGRRFALTIAANGARWSIEKWRGPEGAAPAAMAITEGGGLAPAVGTPKLDQTYFSFRASSDETTGPGVLVVIGRGISDVEVASGFDYAADGRKTATWRPLEPEAAVWVREVMADEIDSRTVRARTVADGLRREVGGGGAYGQAPLPAGMSDVAPAGTDPEVLTCAAMAFAPERGGFPRGSTPILGGSPQVGDAWYGIAVAKAHGGGYLVGSCPTLHPEYSNSMGAQNANGYVVPAPEGGPDNLFTIVGTTTVEAKRVVRGDDRNVLLGQSEGAGLSAVVVAPKGTAEVEVAGLTVPVRDRLAVVKLPKDTPAEGLTATARAADGSILGTTTGLAKEEGDVNQESFYDVDLLDEPYRR
jgi:hypothetical protein